MLVKDSLKKLAVGLDKTRFNKEMQETHPILETTPVAFDNLIN